MNILKRIFGKRKDGKCRWWNHDFGDSKKIEYMVNTGSYIDGKPIQKKVFHYESTCKKCGETTYSDIFYY